MGIWTVPALRLFNRPADSEVGDTAGLEFRYWVQMTR